MEKKENERTGKEDELKKDQNKWVWIKAILTLLIGFIGLIIAYYHFRATDRQTKIAQESENPIISVYTEDSGNDLTDDVVVEIVKNYAKSAEVEMYPFFFVWYYEDVTQMGYDEDSEEMKDYYENDERYILSYDVVPITRFYITNGEVEENTVFELQSTKNLYGRIANIKPTEKITQIATDMDMWKEYIETNNIIEPKGIVYISLECLIEVEYVDSLDREHTDFYEYSSGIDKFITLEGEKAYYEEKVEQVTLISENIIDELKEGSHNKEMFGMREEYAKIYNEEIGYDMLGADYIIRYNQFIRAMNEALNCE